MRIRSRALYAGPAGRDWGRIARRVLITLLITAVLITAVLITLGTVLSGEFP